MQHHATNELHIEWPQSQRPRGRLPGDSKRFWQQLIQRLPVGDALLEFGRLAGKILVAEGLQALFKLSDLSYVLLVLLHQPLVSAAKDSGYEIRH